MRISWRFIAPSKLSVERVTPVCTHFCADWSTRLPQAADDYARWFLARVRAIQPVLEQDFICAGRFTAADISVGYAFMLAQQVGLHDDLIPAAQAYWARLQTRPSFAAAQAAQKAAAQAQSVPTGW